jgi:hypothetical protein
MNFSKSAVMSRLAKLVEFLASQSRHRRRYTQRVAFFPVRRVIVVALVLFLQRQESLVRSWPAGSNADDWDRHRAICDLVNDDALSTR